MQILSNRIRELREEADLSMSQLAEKIGVSNAAICKWENQLAEPKATYLQKLADFFKKSADYLLGRSDDYGNIVIQSENYFDTSPLEQRLILDFRKLSPSLQDAAIETVRVLAGASSENGLQKKG